MKSKKIFGKICFWLLIVAPLIIFNVWFPTHLESEKLRYDGNFLYGYISELNFVFVIGIYFYWVFILIYICLLSFCYKKAGYARKKPQPKIENIDTYNEMGYKKAAKYKKLFWCWILVWFILYNILWFTGNIPQLVWDIYAEVSMQPWLEMLLTCFLFVPIIDIFFFAVFFIFLKKSKFTPKFPQKAEETEEYITPHLQELEYKKQINTSRFFFLVWLWGPTVFIMLLFVNSISLSGIDINTILVAPSAPGITFMLMAEIAPSLAIIYMVFLVILFEKCKFKFTENLFREPDKNEDICNK